MGIIKKLLLCCLCILPFSIEAKEIKLLTSIKLLQLIAAAIQKDISQPDVLLPIGASAHHYALKPSDIQRIQSADLFYWIGTDMEVFLTKVIQNSTNKTVAIEQLTGIKLHRFTDHHQHDERDNEHQIGSIDPHLWLSIDNAKVIATQMTIDLSQLDTDNKEKYQYNLNVFLANLDTVQNSTQQTLNKASLKPFFVLHETYNYFEDTFGIRHVGVFNLNATIQPSIKQVTEMKTTLKNAGESCIFYEPPIRPKLIDTLIEGLPTEAYELDAMGTTIPITADGYPLLLKNLTNELLKCRHT